ncbi:MAG: P-loop NTPase, partial [Candidatus Kaelpia aquatica]|nr:P-loop NTPase [Candidatus Kaelpia aquatica]
GAIEMRENSSGEWFISDTRFGELVHAKLGIAEENSGKLVSLVRQKAKDIAKENNYDWIIIDGSPGIGCPVIASISGVDCALVVTEPTLSGLHDADRVIKVARHFNVPVRLIVNKYDLNIDVTSRIENYCQDNDVEFMGKIAFDKTVVEAMVEGKTIIEYVQTETKDIIIEIWDRLIKSIE